MNPEALLDYLVTLLTPELPGVMIELSDTLWAQVRDDRQDYLFIGIRQVSPYSSYVVNHAYNTTDQKFDAKYQNLVKMELQFDYYFNTFAGLSLISIIHGTLTANPYPPLDFAVSLLFIDQWENTTSAPVAGAYIKQRYTWSVFYMIADEGGLAQVNRVKEIFGGVEDTKAGISGDFTIDHS